MTARLLNFRCPANSGNAIGRAFAMAAVVFAHAGLLLFILYSRATPAVVTSPPAVMGVLVSEHRQPPSTPPVAAPTPRARPTPAAAPQHELPPSERAPVLPTEPAVQSPAPAAPVETATVPAAAPASADNSASGPVTPPRSEAAHLNNPKPVYPAVSRRLKEAGRVVLDVYILPDGSVGQLRVKVSSGYPRLDEAALAAVRRWTYVPARRGNDAVALWHAQSLVFSLIR